MQGSTCPVPYQTTQSAAGAGPVPCQTSLSAAGVGPVYGHTRISASAPAYANPYASLTASLGASSSIQDGLAFPERPGQPECHYLVQGSTSPVPSQTTQYAAGAGSVLWSYTTICFSTCLRGAICVSYCFSCSFEQHPK